jgi:predicted acetyltransferase
VLSNGFGLNVLSLKKRYSLLFNYENIENLRIISEDSKIVSHQGICEREILVLGCKIKVGSIGFVSTIPEYRNRGYATLLFDDCIRKTSKDGVDIMLVSGDRGLYRRAGCKNVGKVYNFKIKKDDALVNNNIKVSKYKIEDLNYIIKAYEKEPVRFYRSFLDYSSISKNPYYGEMLTLKKCKKFLGYIVIDVNDEKKGKVIEYAGIRKSLFNSILPIFNFYNLNELDISVPCFDNELIFLLLDKKFKFKCSNSPLGTVKILNFIGLMTKLEPYLKENLSEKELRSINFYQNFSNPRVKDKFTIQFGKEELITNMIEYIVFGVVDKTKIPKINRKLLEIINRIFPIPLVWQGLNLV